MTGAGRSESALSRVGIVARKEILDIVRDRRTMLVTLVTAIVAGPVLMMLVLNLIARQADKVRELTLPAIGIEQAPALQAFLERQQVTLTPAPADFDAKIRSGDLDIVLEIDPAFAADVAQGRPGTVRLAYDRSRDRARAAIAEVEGLLRAFNREWGRGRLLLRGIAPEVANPLNVESRDLATPQSSGALVLFLIAFYGLFAAVMGGMAAALDTTAGERERMSLEPLLTTPVAPLELATGKWLAVSLLNAAAVVLTLSGFYLTLRFAPLPAVGIPFLFGLAEFGRFIVALVPLILLMPAILLYVGCRGRTFKEAQSNLSVLLFAVSLLPIVQMFLQKKEPAWLTWIPVSGQYTLLSRALRGEALPWLELLQSYVVPGLLTLGALLAVARLFSRESLLAGK
jgi:sodium transport system permease protein